MLLRVEMPWAVFGLITDAAGVTRAAPIAHYTVGWDYDQVCNYFVGRGGKVEEL